MKEGQRFGDIEQELFSTQGRRELPDGRVVVDERCQCGALRSEHTGFDKHGPGPNCDRFTWVGFVYEDGTED